MCLRFLLLPFAFSFLLNSCSDTPESHIRKALIGTWVLDSSVTSVHRARSENTFTERITFIDDSTYERYWMEGDVGNEYQGRYGLVRNPERGGFTLLGVPGIQPSGDDTIRMAYDVFDLVTLQDSVMITVSASTIKEVEPGRWRPFHKRRYYHLAKP